MNAEVPSQLAHRTRLFTSGYRHVGKCHWWSHRGFCKRRCDVLCADEKKHREAVKELRHDMSKLCGEIEVALNMVASERNLYPDDLHATARDIELKATKLADEDLKRDVIETLNKEYESARDVDTSLWKLRERLDRRAFPTLHEMKRDYMDVKDKNKRLFGDGSEVEWAGPASSDFISKAREEGYTLRTDARRKS